VPNSRGAGGVDHVATAPIHATFGTGHGTGDDSRRGTSVCAPNGRPTNGADEVVGKAGLAIASSWLVRRSALRH
jgi:hypothetical protein